MSNLIGRSVLVRNRHEVCGLNGDIDYDTGTVPGAPEMMEGVIVESHPCHSWQRPGSGWVRVEYPARYFGCKYPRYGNVSMRKIKVP